MSISMRCCSRYSWALFSTLSRISSWSAPNPWVLSPPPLWVAVIDMPSPPKVSLAVRLKCVFSCAFLTISLVRAGGIGGLGLAGLEVVLDLLYRSRLLGDRAGGVAPDLLGRERDRADEVADLVLLGLPGLAVGHHDPEVDGVLGEHVEGVALGEQFLHLDEELRQPAGRAERIGRLGLAGLGRPQGLDRRITHAGRGRALEGVDGCHGYLCPFQRNVSRVRSLSRSPSSPSTYRPSSSSLTTSSSEMNLSVPYCIC